MEVFITTLLLGICKGNTRCTLVQIQLSPHGLCRGLTDGVKCKGGRLVLSETQRHLLVVIGRRIKNGLIIYTILLRNKIEQKETNGYSTS